MENLKENELYHMGVIVISFLVKNGYVGDLLQYAQDMGCEEQMNVWLEKIEHEAYGEIIHMDGGES